jgi:ABC-2 type transport system permease protein
MMGKVLGIGAMGVTQWLIWICAGVLISIVAAGILAGLLPDPATLGADAAMEGVTMDQIQQFVPEIPLMFPFYFLLFFLGGYLLYSSLMAAVGSAVEQESDAQQFMWIVVMPLIVPTILIFNLMNNPDGTLATVMSLIPLFSPIVMVVRIAATNVPLWQIWLSLVLLAGAFVLAIWISSRIYRVGILSYGKKPTFAELARWIRQP